MMNQIKMYIKIFIKIKFLIFIILYSSITLAESTSNHSIEKKKKSFESIDLEIKNLETDLENQIKNQKDSKNKIIKLKSEIENKKLGQIHKKRKKESKEEYLIKSNEILDSLINNLNDNKEKQKRIEIIVENINEEKQSIELKIQNIDNNIIQINQKMDFTLDSLYRINAKIKNILIETLDFEIPTEIEFLIESNSWDNFVLQNTLYELLIDNEKQNLNNLLDAKNIINIQYEEDSLMKNNLIINNKDLNEEKLFYENKLNDFNNYKISINELIIEKEKFIIIIKREYDEIANQLNEQNKEIKELTDSLNNIERIKDNANENQKKIKNEIIIKKEARKLISIEIEKLIQTNKRFDGKKIYELKGNLPWPTEGEIITNFGKNRNPDTGITINYDLIEIQPMMNKDEEIQYLVKQINPNNPNKKLVKKFQNLTMNMKKGDRGYGVFGPKTTAMWKKYNNISFAISEQPIFSIHDGIIESVSFINPMVGIVVIIRHDNNYFSVYSGNIDVYVMEGAHIKGRAKIGAIKRHNLLSFQLWNNNTPIDPREWFIKK